MPGLVPVESLISLLLFVLAWILGSINSNYLPATHLRIGASHLHNFIILKLRYSKVATFRIDLKCTRVHCTKYMSPS